MSDELEGDNPQEVPLYKCMFCGERHTGRGMEGHVRLSRGDGHGPRGTIPDEYDVLKCEQVGVAEERTFADKQDLLEHLRDEWRREDNDD